MSAGLGDAWAALVGTALLGTDRRPLPPAPGGMLAGFGEGSDPAVALLERVAAVSLARRAGARPGPVPAPLTACPVDDRPPCPPAAAARLAGLLAADADLLPEWLDRLAAGGWRLPPEHAVGLLQRAVGRPDLAPAVHAAVGPLAGWLALLFPELGLSVAASAGRRREGQWRTGSPAERLAVLEAVRADDPAAGRDLLAAVWGEESAASRAALLGALTVGLGPDDEGFLEAALDDRSVTVRRQAADLLASLPGSALSARMAARLATIAEAVRRWSHLRVVLHDPPVPPPPDWVRDGLDSRPPAGTARRAWLVRNVVAAAPLGAWAAIGPPDEVVVALLAYDDTGLLKPALAAAIRRSGDPVWAAALLARTGDTTVVDTLDPPALAAVARAGAGPDRLLGPVTRACLATLPTPWPDDLQAAVLATLAKLFREGRIVWAHLPALHDLVVHLDPALLVPLADALGAVPPLAQQAAVQVGVVELARARHTMLEELS